MVRAHVLVEGRVQGVGYRAFVHRNAVSEGLSGWVKNLSDGRVELEVQGSREKIDLFLVSLKKGPALAQVDQLHMKWLDIQEERDGFRIMDLW
ncbi:MAG: acylphosphatase [Nitrospirota bacterium]|nr:MAG: acylphosphatase [Nitrospirota bacterium]